MQSHGFSTTNCRVAGENAITTAIKSSTFREILRATEALQDDRFTVSFSLIAYY
jgi:hypothetical protein